MLLSPQLKHLSPSVPEYFKIKGFLRRLRLNSFGPYPQLPSPNSTTKCIRTIAADLLFMQHRIEFMGARWREESIAVQYRCHLSCHAPRRIPPLDVSSCFWVQATRVGLGSGFSPSSETECEHYSQIGLAARIVEIWTIFAALTFWSARTARLSWTKGIMTY
ncbi:hypothetical protein BJV78DRAFT_1165225 [Lactifluus subvellereus]|nr:hypothetical protein BJV78DRAFT_1165225 [Lactifluus subvellereus]